MNQCAYCLCNSFRDDQTRSSWRLSIAGKILYCVSINAHWQSKDSNDKKNPSIMSEQSTKKKEKVAGFWISGLKGLFCYCFKRYCEASVRLKGGWKVCFCVDLAKYTTKFKYLLQNPQIPFLLHVFIVMQVEWCKYSVKNRSECLKLWSINLNVLINRHQWTNLRHNLLVSWLKPHQRAKVCSILLKQSLVHQSQVSLLCVGISELRKGTSDRGQFIANVSQITLCFAFILDKFLTHLVANLSRLKVYKYNDHNDLSGLSCQRCLSGWTAVQMVKRRLSSRKKNEDSTLKRQQH